MVAGRGHGGQYDMGMEDAGRRWIFCAGGQPQGVRNEHDVRMLAIEEATDTGPI